MTPETFYKATPVSEFSTTKFFDARLVVIENDLGEIRTDKLNCIDYVWMGLEKNERVTHILSPVTLKDVPTASDITSMTDELPYTKGVDDGGYNDGQIVGFLSGAERILNQCLPLLASLQSKVEELESTKTSLLDYDKNMARENAEKKQVIEGLQRKVDRLEKELEQERRLFNAKK